MEPDLHAWMLRGELADGRRHERRTRREERPDPEEARFQPGESSHVLLGCGCGPDESSGMFAQPLARRGEPDGTAPALEETHPKVPLEVCDVMRNSGLRVVEGVGG